MQDVRFGIRVRALRHRLGWRQSDLAARAKVTQGLVSLVERGRLEHVTIAKIRRIAVELDAELVTQLRWRGGDLDRLVDEGHATLVGRIVALLRSDGWDCRIEVTYAVYGERGSIDVLAWHERTRTLLVVEVKTELVAVEETLRKHDEKARLAPRVVEPFGWKPAAVARLLVLPALTTPRRRVGRHAAVMSAAYPLRGSDLRRWLAAPAGTGSGLAFLDPGPGRTSVRRKRIRVALEKVRS